MWTALAACLVPPAEAPEQPNVLLVLLDDVGVDEISAYGWPDAAPTPVIDGLAARGVRFDRAWSTPTCSPSRAALLTGRMPDRNGVGAVLTRDLAKELDLDEITLAEALAATDPPTTSAVVGKWHLATASSPSGASHPLLQGFSAFAGTLDNIVGDAHDGGDQAFDSWDRYGFDGELRRDGRFATDAVVDDAIGLLPALPEPWFLYLPLHAAHEPRTPPPGSGVDPDDEAAVYRANVAYADAAVGRLLAALDDDDLARTLVVVAGDNGTPLFDDGAVDPGLPGGKVSMTEGGLRVPLVFAGARVPVAGVSDALVHLVDVFPTVLELAGAPRAEAVLDGRSLVPILADPGVGGVRRVAYTEYRNPPDGPPWTLVTRGASDGTWKWVDDAGDQRLWRLGPDGAQERAAFEDAPADALSALEAALALHPP